MFLHCLSFLIVITALQVLVTDRTDNGVLDKVVAEDERERGTVAGRKKKGRRKRVKVVDPAKKKGSRISFCKYRIFILFFSANRII